MATFNDGKSKSPELPTEQDLVAYEHAAAGHEGISSIDDGSIIIKPCTEAEINFYQVAQTHEALKAHMPIFMGVLALSSHQAAPPGDVGPAIQISGDVLSDTQSFTEGRNQLLSGNDINRSVQVHQEIPTEVTVDVPQNLSPDPAVGWRSSPSKPKRTSWKPSGGKKIDTPHAIVLENVASGFRQPNILDIKLGARLWAEDAPEAKRIKLDDVAATTTSSKIGYRIAGMKRYVGPKINTAIYALQNKKKGIRVKDNYLCYNKEYGRSFNIFDVKDAFVEYLGGTYQDKNDECKFTRPNIGYLLRRIITKLTELKYTIDHEETRMYSSSILLVIEGDLSQQASQAALDGDRTRQEIAAKANMEHARNQSAIYRSIQGSSDGSDTYFEEGSDSDGSDETDGVPKLFDLRLIDFAHADFVPGKGSDLNILLGITHLLFMFTDLLKMAGGEPGPYPSELPS